MIYLFPARVLTVSWAQGCIEPPTKALYRYKTRVVRSTRPAWGGVLDTSALAPSTMSQPHSMTLKRVIKLTHSPRVLSNNTSYSLTHQERWVLKSTKVLHSKVRWSTTIENLLNQRSWASPRSVTNQNQTVKYARTHTGTVLLKRQNHVIPVVLVP